jgi:uncharacterized protein (DUF1778 family)
MSEERERAAYYEAHKDQPDDWGEPTKSKARRRLASMISVRLSAGEAAAVRAAAEERGISVSAFLREAALKEAEVTPADEPDRGHVERLRALYLEQLRAVQTQMPQLVKAQPPELVVLAAPPPASLSLVHDADDLDVVQR